MKITWDKLILIACGLVDFTPIFAKYNPRASAPFEESIPLFFAGAIVLGIYKLRKKK